jgi:hypothetical protein
MVNLSEKTSKKHLSKNCNSCSLHLPFSAFQSNTGGRFGLRASCISCEQARKAALYVKNRETILLNKKTYAKLNKKKISEKNKLYCNNRLKSDPSFKLKNNVARMIRYAMQVKNAKKNSTVEQLIGCSILQLKQHLESKFKADMSWTNYGAVWHIDHICPNSQAVNLHELIKLQHHSNLQPLHVNDNIIKSDKKTPYSELMCKILLERDWV